MRFLDVRLDLDTGCNYRCVYCQNRPSPGGGATHFPLDKFIDIVPILKKHCWSVYLACGGEPTLHPDFIEIMRKHVPRLSAKTDVFLVTNGFRLGKNECEAIVESGITRVNVSVDTVDANLYGRLCGCAPGALNTVLSNIETLLKVRGKRKYPKVFLTSVALKSTLEKMPDVCEWVVKTGLDGHRIQLMIPYDTIGMEAEDVSGSAQARAIFIKCKSILRMGGKGGVYCDIPLTFSDRLKSTVKGALLVKNKVEYAITSAKKLWASIRKPNCRLAGQLIRVDSAGNAEFCERCGIQPGNLFNDSNVKPGQRVRDAYNRIRKGNMSACAADCPSLIT